MRRSSVNEKRQIYCILSQILQRIDKNLYEARNVKEILPRRESQIITLSANFAYILDIPY